MTREDALKNLNLSPSAGQEEIEKAYQRLVHRYPPEFQPEKFRQIDESNPLLTSLPFLLEKLLSPSIEESEVAPDLFEFSPAIADTCLEEAVREIRRFSLVKAIWQGSTGGEG